MALVSCGFGYVLYVASLIYLIIPLTFFFSVLMG
jgi:hypothetical protein